MHPKFNCFQNIFGGKKSLKVHFSHEKVPILFNWPKWIKMALNNHVFIRLSIENLDALLYEKAPI